MFSVRIKHKHTHIHIHVACKFFLFRIDDHCGFTLKFVMFAINVKLNVIPKNLSTNHLIALD
jgi:hypothetical protein